MSLDNSKNSYGAADDLETGVKTSHIKDAADGPRRFTVIATVGLFGLLGFVAAMPTSSRSSTTASLYNKWAQEGIDQGNFWRNYGQQMGQKWRDYGQQMGDVGRDYGQHMGDVGRATGEAWRNYGQNIANNYGGHGIVIGGDDKCNSVTMDSSINGKYVKFAHTGPHGLADNTKWKSTNGQTCESIYTSGNKKSHCKQANKHGVTGNDACQCSC